MGGARKFQLGGSRGAEGRARGAGIWAGASQFFFIRGWAGTHTDKCRMHVQMKFALTLPPLEKNCCLVQQRAHLCIF